MDKKKMNNNNTKIKINNKKYCLSTNLQIYKSFFYLYT